MFCIDFGASGGVDRNLEKMLPDAKIALLEPGLEFFKKLPKKKGLVNLRAAAGRYSNETYLFNYETPGASIFKENSKILKRYAQHVVERKENKQNKIKIKITSIKKILKKISFNRIDAIKIDTQGSELKILEGLKDAGKLKNVCSIFCEAQSIPESYKNSPKMIHILNFLSKNDFELFDILPNRAFALIKKDSFLKLKSSRMCFVYSPGPATLEAKMTLSRFPVFLNHDPMIRSVSPCVFALAGTG